MLLHRWKVLQNNLVLSIELLIWIGLRGEVLSRHIKHHPFVREKMKSSYCILVSLWKALTNLFSFLRLCQSKQSKVYLPEPPFPHAEVHVQSLALVLQILTLQIYQLSTKDFPFGSSWGFGVTPSSEIQGLWVDFKSGSPALNCNRLTIPGSPRMVWHPNHITLLIERLSSVEKTNLTISQQPIRCTKNITRSQWESRVKKRKKLQARENVRDWF